MAYLAILFIDLVSSSSEGSGIDFSLAYYSVRSCNYSSRLLFLFFILKVIYSGLEGSADSSLGASSALALGTELTLIKVALRSAGLKVI